MKKLSDYRSLSKVPLNHPEVKFKCDDPAIYCKDAVGNNGCLAKDHKKGECLFMRDKIL